MVEPKPVTIDGKEYKRYADSTYKIRKVGTDEIYDEAYDLLTSEYEYEETDELIAENEQEF